MESKAASRPSGARKAVRPGRTTLWLGTCLALGFGVLWDSHSLPDARQRLDQIPKQGPGFTCVDVPLTESEQAVLGRANVIHRRYQFGDHFLFVTVIDGTKDRHAVHDPGYCFEGAGWRIEAQDRLNVPGGAARWIQASRDGERLESVSWFADDSSRHASFPRYCFQTAWRRMTLGHSGPEPILVVLQYHGNDPPDWPVFLERLTGTLHL